MFDPVSIADEIAKQYSKFPEVEAVVLSGSLTSESMDSLSDIDLYIYSHFEIPVSERSRLIKARSSHKEINNRFWEPGDEWVEVASGISVDVMYRSPDWIQEQLDRVLLRHVASVGYSTCFWHNVLFSRALYDKKGWYASLQEKAKCPYPEPLRKAIIQKNHPILRHNMSSYLHQMEKAILRNDPVSLNHRQAALLASYFDILFALNRVPHPGEKQLIEKAEKSCRKLPSGMRQDLERLLQMTNRSNKELIEVATAVLDGLDRLLAQEQLLPS